MHELSYIKAIAREDVTLLFLSSIPAAFFSSIALQKGVFLLSRNIPDLFDTPYNFIPYDYGPFDREVYQDVDKLIERKLVRVINKDRRDPMEWIATPLGLERSRELAPIVTEKQSNYMKVVAEWVLANGTGVIGSIVRAYPEMGTQMIFRS